MRNMSEGKLYRGLANYLEDLDLHSEQFPERIGLTEGLDLAMKDLPKLSTRDQRRMKVFFSRLFPHLDCDLDDECFAAFSNAAIWCSTCMLL